ncbi:MAG: acetate kinase [Gammaproteobacteria bacterium]|nr:acetate kinase [Gammaproteobacteria bacterium]
MTKLALVLNCGSSSIKFAVINPETANNRLSGLVECIGSKDARMKWSKDEGKKTKVDLPNVNYHSALQQIVELIKQDPEMADNIKAVGHRVVHGGEKFTKSALIDEKVLNTIRDCQALAPLHNPANIQGIEVAKQAFPNLKHTAVFDTAFHQTMPKHAYLYAIPHELYEEHKIRRYGFHGTSHLYVSREAARILGRDINKCNLITAHLGNGCSICAIKNGKSVDTSMGLTPLEGLVMGTRSGDIDPSIHSHLVDTLGYDIHKVTNLLNKESGLLGISKLDSDCRAIEDAAAEGHELATLAAEIFCYRLAKYIGSYAVAIGSIDALVFTGGIGENSPFMRKTTLKWLGILGFNLDEELNNASGKNSNGLITEEHSTKALVIPTNEELIIARDAVQLANS